MLKCASRNVRNSCWVDKWFRAGYLVGEGRALQSRELRLPSFQHRFPDMVGNNIGVCSLD